MIKVAYIGAGAVVQRSHLPALKLFGKMELSAIADAAPSCLADLSEQHADCLLTHDVQEAINSADLVVIATPSASHYELGMQALSSGKHVLMEKPLAVTQAHASEMVTFSKQNSKVLAVSLVRRFVTHNLLFKHLISNGLVGDIQQVEVEEGSSFGWPVQSVDFYDPKKSGGGVLIDNGAHLLDLLIWWLGPLNLVGYRDDAQGGVEAECEIAISTENGANGTVKMSRLRTLKNQIIVKGTLGSIKMDLASGLIEVQFGDAPEKLLGNAHAESGAASPQSVVELFAAQYSGINNMISGIESKQAGSVVLGSQCLSSIELMDECYRIRQPLTDLVM